MAARSSAKGPAGSSRATAQSGPALERSHAFDREIVAHFPWVQRVSRRLSGNASEAEDLVQETFLRALRGAARFRSGTNFKAWLLTILRHAHLNRRRGIARAIVEIDEAKVGSFAETLQHRDTPERQLLERSLDDQLRAANASLPVSLRETLWLRDIEELSYAEIANRLRIPVGTVMSRLSRARRLLYERVTG